uniref:Protein kinase domain-containing protein n=1 Tax=Meloidogyne floridensis TaxID=298350 RepID=A0A915P9A8_9BILA
MFFIPILFQLLPTLVYSQIYCDLCGYEFRGAKEEIFLNDVHPTSTSVSTLGEEITLEYDSEEIGSGSFSEVYHATLKEGYTLGGKNREELGCIALKETIMTEETRNKTSIELMQRNEWEILRLFSGLGEENNKRIIKLYAAKVDNTPTKRILYSLLEWGDGGNFRNYINNKQIEWGRGGNWQIDDNKVFGVVKDPVLVMGELHQKVIHLDFKPENLIYVTKNEETILKAIDFGGAKIFGINDQRRLYHSVNIQNQLCIFSQNSPLSTKAYRSPEHRNLLCRQHNICPVHEQCPENNSLCREHQKTCHKNTYYLLSVKSDIWAIGAILIQIAMGDLLAKEANGDIAILNEDNQQ